jgi:uncharacterized protein (DUF1501 family)
MTIKRTRRNFLMGSLAAGGALSTLGGLDPILRLAQAAEPAESLKDRYFIFCYFGGGWDVLVSLDPRDPNKFNASNAETTRILPGYDLLDNPPDPFLIPTSYGFLGAYLGDLATKHADKISVVRGMNMETLSHDAGQKRFTTGKPPSGTQARGSSATTWFASLLGKKQIIPNLVSNSQVFNADQPTYASGIKVASVNDLLQAVRAQEPSLSSFMDQQLDLLLAEAAECPRTQSSLFMSAAELSRQKSVSMVSSNIDSYFDFAANTPEMEALRDHYGFTKNELYTGPARAAMAARAIISGVSRAASVSVVNAGLDTHFDDWSSVQGPRQMQGFNSIARMVEDLEAHEYKNTGSSWMDHTNIVAYSEFSRTPLINSRGGRDHWLGNSALMLGADIQGGLVAGASSNVGMQPMAFDPITGLVDPGGEVMKPEHVLQTLFEALGITDDPADLRCSPITALLKK